MPGRLCNLKFFDEMNEDGIEYNYLNCLVIPCLLYSIDYMIINRMEDNGRRPYYGKTRIYLTC
jgi:hypothetical protein